MRNVEMMSSCGIRIKERINEDRGGISAKEAVHLCSSIYSINCGPLVYDFMDPSKSKKKKSLGDS